MDTQYFRFVRSEIAPLLPTSASHILDVGCGVGATAAWVRARYPGSRATGFEGNPALRAELADNLDAFHITDLNSPLPDMGQPDLVLLLDVLEHLLHPERVLANIVAKAAPNATFIISLPNIAHLSVAAPLLLRGRFAYADAGILDRTHLHFYTIETAIALANAAGLVVHNGVLSGFGGPKTRWLDRATFGRLRSRLAKQCIMAATPDTGAQPEVTWRLW